MPDWGKEIRASVAGLKLEAAREAEIVEELGQHMNDRYEDLLAGGEDAEHATRAVIEELRAGKLAVELHAVLQPQRETLALGEKSHGGVLGGLGKDMVYGARLLRRDPAFALIAILSLALGIGANTAIFQLLDAVRLRTLPVHDAQKLTDVRIVENPHGRTGNFTGQSQLTSAIWERLQKDQHAFSGIAAWSSQRMNLSQGGEARYAEALWVSGGFFDVLEVRPVLGRLISTADDQRGCGAPGAVISNSFWQGEFGGRQSVIGAMVTVEGHRFEIIGVTPSSFYGVEVGKDFDIALPVCAEPIVAVEPSRINDAEGWWLAAIGRLKPGWTLDRASSQLAAISPGIFAATLPPEYDSDDGQHYLGFKLGALPAASGVSDLRKEYENPLWLLMAISGLVLLIACTNLANLMLARASSRQREMAVRLALGASRSRLIRQLLAESMLMAIIGAASGAWLARLLSRFLVSFLSTQRTRLFVDLAPDWRVLAFTAGLAVLTCLLFGLAPALRASRTPLGEVMKASGRGLTAGRERFGLRRALVVSQVALSLVLLVGALLFVRTLRNLETLDAGFRRDHILIADIDFSPLKLPVERRTAYKQDLLTRVRAVPGVLSASSAMNIPLSGSGSNRNINILGSSVQRRLANFNWVSPGYFRSLGTPLLAGRDFADSDAASSPQVAIVTETFARKFVNGSNPVGATLGVVQQGGKPDRIYQIVGLVKDSKYNDLREEFTPIVFVPEAQEERPDPEAQLVIHSDEPLINVVSSVKQAVAEISPALVINFTVFDTSLREGLMRERLMATLSGFFGFLAAILAMIGLYGVISYMVICRRNEIGIRMALGASRPRILSMIMREAATLLSIGLVIGTVLTLAAGTTARSLLFGLQPSDPITLVIAISSLALIALAASFLPAQRAAALDPMQALRDE